MKKVCIVVLFLVFIASVGFAAESMEKSVSGGQTVEEQSFSAVLTGASVVPTVTTDAKGDARFHLSKDGKKLFYRIKAAGLEGITAAHIHMGKKGENGPPIALINVKPAKAKKTGTIAKGAVTKNELMTSLKGKDLSALIDEINAENAYVNVHTAKNPDGEIRGQIGK